MNTETIQTIAALSGRSSVLRTTDQTIANNSATTVDYGAGGTVVGAGLTFATGSPTILTAKTSGLYLVTGEILWAANADGRRDLWVYSGATAVGMVRQPAITAGLTTYQTVVALVPLAIGGTLSLKVLQTSGGDLALTAGDFTPKLSAVRVGP